MLVGAHKRGLALVLVLLAAIGCALPALAGAAPSQYPIRSGVKIKVPTADGVRTVSVGGLSRAEVIAKLKQYPYRGNPKVMRIRDRGITYLVNVEGIRFMPSVYSMASMASTTATDTVASMPYLTKELRASIAAKVSRWADNRYVRSRTVALSGSARLKRFGGYRIDKGKTTTLALIQIREFGTSRKASIDPITGRTANPLPIVENNRVKVLAVSKRQRRVYFISGNKVVTSYPVAIGTSSYPTPTGSFVISRKVVNPTWYNPGSAWATGMPATLSGPSSPLGARALYLYQGGRDTGIRFHGTAAGYSIGTAASHGCMRMYNSDVKKLYDQVPLGTRVYIYN